MFKKILIIISFIAIFCLSILVWYSPVLFKGYNLSQEGSYSLIKSRNLAITGKNSAENELNVTLSSELVPEQGQKSLFGNKLATFMYSRLFKLINIVTSNIVVFINCIFLALSLLIFGLTVYYLFDYKTSLFFSLIYIFLPTNWLLPQILVGYVFALIFLALFFLFFSYGTQKFSKDKDTIKSFKFWPHGACLILSGVFLVIACLAREALFLIMPILFIFLLVLKLKKYFYYIFIPVIILLIVFWLPDFITDKNTYLVYFSIGTSQELKSSDYSHYAHLYPDPYTYHFNEENFLKEKTDFSDTDIMTEIGARKVLTNMGARSMNLWQRIKVGTVLTVRHVFRFFSITEMGGPLIFFLLFLGLCVLKKQKNYWFSFAVFWFIGSIFLLTYINLAQRNHLMDFAWMIALCVSLGIILLAEFLNKHLNKPHTIEQGIRANQKTRGKKKIIIEILVLLLVVYNLVLCGHVMWGQKYDQSVTLLLTAYANKIEEANIKSADIIAVPLTSNGTYGLNFITDKSFIVFRPETIEQLLEEQYLKQAFEKFKVTHILGYSPEMSDDIMTATQTKIIADDSIPVFKENEGVSNKNWFLNLVK